MLKNHLICLLSLSLLSFKVIAQPCTPQGDQVTYGSNDVWIGYVYDNANFTNYAGYITAGTSGDPDFSENFGGLYVNFPTNGCPIYTETFSVRYKLTKTFTSGSYEFTVSGDDAVRFSIDGGNTWLINNWTYNNYTPSTVTINLSGTYNMVIEYMEGAHHNQVYFSVINACTATGNTMVYGSGNIWNGYVFSGINFDRYKGMVHEGTISSMSFSQNFGGNSVEYPTSDCPVLTDFFSVRYRLRKHFANNSYTLTISADDKYRLSLDGGNTWVIDRWSYVGSYSTRNYVANLNGDYDMVLEYYEKDGDNPLQFSYVHNVLLPLNILTFSGSRVAGGISLNWKISDDPQTFHFEIERSEDGRLFQTIGEVEGVSNKVSYSFIDGNLPSKALHYRLKATDSQGKVAYSKTIELPLTIEGIQIFPTMVTGNMINIRNQQALTNAVIVVSDMNGRSLVNQQLGKLSSNQSTGIYLGDAHLTPGVYIVRLYDNRQPVKVEKIFIQ